MCESNGVVVMSSSEVGLHPNRGVRVGDMHFEALNYCPLANNIRSATSALSRVVSRALDTISSREAAHIVSGRTTNDVREEGERKCFWGRQVAWVCCVQGHKQQGVGSSQACVVQFGATLYESKGNVKT